MKLFTLLLSLLIATNAMGAKTFIDRSLVVGDNTSNDMSFGVNPASNANTPQHRYNFTESAWEVSDDGLDFRPVGSGSGSGGINNLVNGDFEKSSITSGWTVTGTGAVGTTHKVQGKRGGSVTYTASTPVLSQSVTTDIAQLSGRQGVATIWIKTTDTNVTVCAYVDSVCQSTVSSATNPSLSNGSWQELVIPFVFGGTSYGIRVTTSTNSTGVFYVDAAYAGPMPATMMPEVAQAQLPVSGYFPATSSANLSRTSATLGAFGTVAAFPAPTYNINDWGCATTDANKFAVTCTNVPAGRVVFRVYAALFNSASTNATASIFDGATQATSQAINGGAGTANLYPNVITGEFVYTQAGARTFEPYVSSGSGSVTMSVDDSSRGGNPKFEILYYPPASKIYSQQNNTDTDWVSCGLTTADFTGFGTVSSIQDQCKKDGSDLLVRLKFTSGTSTSTEARVNLKLQGTALTSASSTIIPSIQQVGTALRATQTATETYWALQEPSVAYMTFGYQAGTISGLTKQNGSTLIASGNSLAIQARIPIAGWTKTQITGTFANVVTVPGVPKSVRYRADVSGGDAVTNENADWINGNCTDATTGQATCVFNSGIFSSGTIVRCQIQELQTSGANAPALCKPTASPTSTSAIVLCKDGAGSALNYGFTLFCEGQAP